MRNTRSLTILVIATAMVLGACTSPAGQTETQASTAVTQESTPESQGSIHQQEEIVPIDVRTLEEYRDGHLLGSLLIDFQEADFQEEIGKLRRDGHYGIYCRSGNRASQALEVMKAMGFKNVENLGSVDDAAAALGLEIVEGF